MGCVSCQRFCRMNISDPQPGITSSRGSRPATWTFKQGCRGRCVGQTACAVGEDAQTKPSGAEQAAELDSPQTKGITRPPFEGELAAMTLWPEADKVFGHGYEVRLPRMLFYIFSEIVPCHGSSSLSHRRTNGI